MTKVLEVQHVDVSNIGKVLVIHILSNFPIDIRSKAVRKGASYDSNIYCTTAYI